VLKLLQILNKFAGNLILLAPAIPPPILRKFTQGELGFSPRKPDSPATAGLSGFRKVCMGLSGFQIFAASLGEPDNPNHPTATNHRMHNHTIENLEVPPRR
jgi:hypothetical protein